MMKDDGSFYITGAYSAALPGKTDIFDEIGKQTCCWDRDLGFLGGRIGVGYYHIRGSGRRFRSATAQLRSSPLGSRSSAVQQPVQHWSL